MNKEFVPYQPSLDLKELGFDEPCFGYYNGQGNYIGEEGKTNSNCNKLGMHGTYCTAPTFSQSFRWFREKCGLCSWITMELGNKSTFCWVLSGEHTSTQYAAYFHTYEEAELACLIALIVIVKNKKR